MPAAHARSILVLVLKWIFFGIVGLATVAVLALMSAAFREREERVSSSPSGSRYIEALDTRVLIQQRGSADAPAVVFIGGTGGWSGLWARYMRRTVDLGFQAIAIDLPPFGYAIPAPTGDYSKATQGRRLLAAIDSLKLGRVVIVAHSIGAAPVMEAAFQAPSKIRALILIDPALGLDGVQTDGSDSALQALLRHQWISRPVTAILTNTHLTPALLRRVITEKTQATREWVRLYQQPLSLAGTSKAISEWLPEALSRRGRAASDNLSAYAALPFPVELIWGETDTITPLSQGKHLQQLLADSTLIVIPRAGHGPFLEEPDLFEEVLVGALLRRQSNKAPEPL
jgi:pimeloyl-ACP methyl ester carboxylesterase